MVAEFTAHSEYMEKKMKKGDRFTVAGVKKRKDGTYTKRCKPGNETVFIVKKK